MNTAGVRNTYAHGKAIPICPGTNINHSGTSHTDPGASRHLTKNEMQIHVSEMKTKMGGETRYLSGWCCYPSWHHTK